MKNDGGIKLNSMHETSKSAKEKILSPRASRNSKLPDRESVLNFKKPNEQSYAVQQPETMENIDNGKQKQSRKATGAEELVKFMSDVPCYLQRTKRSSNVQEKALNFGVIDWNRLERWKYEQKKVPGGRNVHSSSSSGYTSSSTFGSASSKSLESACETRSHAPKKHLPPLDFYLNISAKDGHAKVLDEGSSAPDTASNDLKAKSRRDQSIGRQHRRSEHEKSNKNDLGSKAVLHNSNRTSENALSNSKDHTPLACAKGKIKARDGESKRRVEQSRELGLHISDENCVNGLNNYEFLSISENQGVKSPDGFPRYQSLAYHDEISAEINHKIFLEDFHFEFTRTSVIPNSCPLPRNSQSSEWLDAEDGTSVDLQDTDTSSDVRHSCADSGEMPITQSKDKNEEQQNQSTARTVELPVAETFSGLVPINAKASTTTTKNSSPTWPSTSIFNTTAKSFSFREVSQAHQVNSTFTPITRSNSSNRDKANTSNRAKSSPLRRILDPLLKPKAAKHLSSDNPLSGLNEDDGTCRHQSDELASTNGAKSPNARSNCCPSVKKNLNFSTFASANTLKKHVGLKKHALLQLAWKNEMPLFTFTFNDSDILAAMMRKVYVSGKDDFEWVYTFYSVHEVKKNKRWMNQGSKRKCHGYCSNAVGQMKVSWSHCQNLMGDDFNNHVMVREFVLFGAELKQAADDTLDLLPSSELAAIIIKAPKEKESFGCDGQKINLSHMEPAKQFSKERDSCCLAQNRSHSSILVVLPGGVHSQPASAGIPSTLIDRWRTGGSCDCGGWDEGCTLRVLSSQSQGSNGLDSSHVCRFSNETLEVDLFIQGGSQENRHVFSLAFFKEGLYTVDFNESISLLQAFSICIAILHGGKPANLSELMNILEIKSSADPTSVENERIKVPNRSKREIPARRSVGDIPTSYLPYPPHSPVGRV